MSEQTENALDTAAIELDMAPSVPRSADEALDAVSEAVKKDNPIPKTPNLEIDPPKTELSPKNAQKTDRKPNRLVYFLWAILFSALTIASTAALAWKGQAWGLPAFVLLIGMAVVGVLAVLTLIVKPTASKTLPYQLENDRIALSHQFFLGLPIASVILKKGRLQSANEAFKTLMSALGDDYDGGSAAIDRAFAGAQNSNAAALYRLHNLKSGQTGREILTLVKANSLGDQARRFSFYVNALDDGTLWQIEEIKHGNDQLQYLSSAPIGLFSIDQEGYVLETNTALEEWLGYDRQNTPNTKRLHIRQFIEDASSLLDHDPIVGRTIRADTVLITANQATIPTIMSGIWRKSDHGEIYASVAVYGHTGQEGQARHGDMSTLRMAANTGESEDNALRGASQPLTRLNNLTSAIESEIVGAAPFGTFHIDTSDLLQARIIDANPAFYHISGISRQSSGVAFHAVLAQNPTNHDFLKAGVQLDHDPVDLTVKNHQAKATAIATNKQINVYFSARQDGGYVGYMIDISKRKELEERLTQSQKMQAIGQLAGGVAHDFNNLLTVIRLNADELLGRHPIGDPSYPELQQINQTVARSAALVKKLLAFSRKQTMRVESLSVTDTLSDLTIMVKRLMVERVKLEMVHGRNLPPFLVDKNQLDTILMNLCVNARDAMVETGRAGTITVRSMAPDEDMYRLDDVPLPKPDELGYVVIEVADTGTGMSDEVKKKIFEPFFTTKEQGKGTGLGLATVYGIVQQMEGHLRVESKVGVGTKFRVYIPIAGDQVVETPIAKSKAEPVKPYDLAGEGHILFVEDESAVRSIAAKTLRKRGYTVTEASDGEEALEILESREHQFDLMVSDVVMPGLEGPQVLKRGREYLGDAKIIFISGYAEEEFSELLAEEPDVTFLPKPFTLTQLAEKVKIVMGQK